MRRLGTDYVDLYQIHRYDSTTPMEETLAALSALVDQGKVLYLGASSMAAWEFAQFLYLADQYGLTRFVSMQNYVNLLYREEEREMLPLCRADGVAVIPWSPLARGALSRPWNSITDRSAADEKNPILFFHQSEADRRIVDRVEEIARARGLPMAQIALAWLMKKPGITAPIVGASRPAHVEDAVAALNITLTPEEMTKLEEPYVPHQVMGFI